MKTPLNLTPDQLHRIADRMLDPNEGTWAKKLGSFLHDVARYADAEHFRANVEANRAYIERYYKPLDASVTADVQAGRNPLANMPKLTAIQALLADSFASVEPLRAGIQDWFGSFDAPQCVKPNEPLDLGLAAFGARPATVILITAQGLETQGQTEPIPFTDLNRAALKWVLQQLENEND